MKKFLYLAIAVALLGMTSCGEGGQGFDDGTPVSETTWTGVEEFNIPIDDSIFQADPGNLDNYFHASLVAKITFYDSVNGEITLEIPELLPSTFRLDFTFTFNGEDGVISYGHNGNHQFKFTRTSSTNLYMTLPGELLEGLEFVEDISELEGNGINIDFAKGEYLTPVLPYTTISGLAGSIWSMSKSVTASTRRLEYYYSLNFMNSYSGLLSIANYEYEGVNIISQDTYEVPFTYSTTGNGSTGSIMVGGQLATEFEIYGTNMIYRYKVNGEGFNTDVPLSLNPNK